MITAGKETVTRFSEQAGFSGQPEILPPSTRRLFDAAREQEVEILTGFPRAERVVEIRAEEAERQIKVNLWLERLFGEPDDRYLVEKFGQVRAEYTQPSLLRVLEQRSGINAKSAFEGKDLSRERMAEEAKRVAAVLKGRGEETREVLAGFAYLRRELLHKKDGGDLPFYHTFAAKDRASITGVEEFSDTRDRTALQKLETSLAETSFEELADSAKRVSPADREATKLLFEKIQHAILLQALNLSVTEGDFQRAVETGLLPGAINLDEIKAVRSGDYRPEDFNPREGERTYEHEMRAVEERCSVKFRRVLPSEGIIFQNRAKNHVSAKLQWKVFDEGGKETRYAFDERGRLWGKGVYGGYEPTMREVVDSAGYRANVQRQVEFEDFIRQDRPLSFETTLGGALAVSTGFVAEMRAVESPVDLKARVQFVEQRLAQIERDEQGDRAIQKCVDWPAKVKLIDGREMGIPAVAVITLKENPGFSTASTEFLQKERKGPDSKPLGVVSKTGDVYWLPWSDQVAEYKTEKRRGKTVARVMGFVKKIGAKWVRVSREEAAWVETGLTIDDYLARGTDDWEKFRNGELGGKKWVLRKERIERRGRILEIYHPVGDTIRGPLREINEGKLSIEGERVLTEAELRNQPEPRIVILPIEEEVEIPTEKRAARFEEE